MKSGVNSSNISQKKNEDISKILIANLKKDYIIQGSEKKANHSYNSSSRGSKSPRSPSSTNSRLSIQDFKDSIMRKIFTFLNVMDLCIITRVCKKWKRMITRDPDIYSIVNLSILPSSVKTLNLMKIVQNDRNIRKLYLPHLANSSDTSQQLIFTKLQQLILFRPFIYSYSSNALHSHSFKKQSLLMSIPKTLEFLQINNVNIEFATVFTQKIPNLTILELLNRNKRKKNLDENELKAISNCCPMIESLTINKAPINDDLLEFFLPTFQNLSKLNLHLIFN